MKAIVSLASVILCLGLYKVFSINNIQLENGIFLLYYTIFLKRLLMLHHANIILLIRILILIIRHSNYLNKTINVLLNNHLNIYFKLFIMLWWLSNKLFWRMLL